MARYDYHLNCISAERAQEVLEDAMAEDWISPAERPQIEMYSRGRNLRGARILRYKITLEH